MASTSVTPSSASWNRRRSSDTTPNGPATATLGSSSAATSAATRSPSGSTLVSMRITTGAAARRIPAFKAAAQPSAADVVTTSVEIPGAPGSAASSPSSSAAWSSEGSLATTTSCVPSGECSTSEPIARARSSGQPVATRTTEATPTGDSSRRDGTEALDPYRTRSPSATSGGAARSTSYSVPLSITFQPAASSSSRSASAVRQSRARRAVARRSARSRMSAGTSSGGTEPRIRADRGTGSRPPPPRGAGGDGGRRAGGEHDQRQDPRVSEPAPQHRAGPPVEPAVGEAAEQRAERLHLGLAKVREHERQRRENDGERPDDAQQREQQEAPEEELRRDDLERGRENHLAGRGRLGPVVRRERRHARDREHDRGHHDTPRDREPGAG